MKIIFTILVMCFGSSVHAAGHTYDLKIALTVDGRKIFSPRIIVNEGEMASVAEETKGMKTFVEVVAIEKPTDKTSAIHMKFVVGSISANGEKKILSTPQIIALENNEASITQGKQDGKAAVTLSVVAKRKTL